MTTTIAQRLVRIPQMWIAGFTQNGATVLQAIEHWESQELLAKEHVREARN